MNISIAMILLTAACFTAIVISLALQNKWGSRITGLATVLAAAGGFFCYGYGFAHQNDFMPLAVVRSVLACLGMFLGRNDFSAVSGTPLFTPYAGQFVFWITHFLAMYATASAALTTIGAGALRRIRLWLARWGDLTVIYGVNPDSVGFGRKLLSRKRHALVFVDTRPEAGLVSGIISMGGVLYQGGADRRFLRSVDMHAGRKLAVYAMHGDAAQNLYFAVSLLEALRQAGVSPRLTSLSISGAEDADGSRLQAMGGNYGYGSVMVFDRATLAARLLMREYPPCRAIGFDKDGRATEDFEALVIGFGQVGQAVLRHLVMYGQFEGSHFSLAVFAPDCQQVNGFLTGSSRALTEQYDIAFYSCDARSPEMYRYLSGRRESLKYVVVCTGSAKLNQEIADELGRFLARLHCGAAVYQCSGQGLLIRPQPGQLPKQMEVYTPEVLCPGRMDRMAAALNQRYSAGNGRDVWENWAGCDYFSRSSSRASADFIPSLLCAAGRTEEQAMAGEWELTEEQLETLGRTEHLRWCAFHYVMGYETMDRRTFEARCAQYRQDVAKTGQSSLRIGKDTALRLHACLIPWEELDALSQAENRVTGGNVDYKQMDKNNVLAVPEILRAGRELGDKEGNR